MQIKMKQAEAAAKQDKAGREKAEAAAKQDKAGREKAEAAAKQAEAAAKQDKAGREKAEAAAKQAEAAAKQADADKEKAEAENLSKVILNVKSALSELECVDQASMAQALRLLVTKANKSIATLDEQVVANVRNMMREAGPGFSSAPLATTDDESPPGSSRSSVFEGNDGLFPDKPILTDTAAFTQLGMDNWPLNFSGFRAWQSQTCDAEPPDEWCVLLFSLLDALLVLVWVDKTTGEPGKSQPLEKPVQSVLLVALNVAGRVFGFSAEPANGRDLFLRDNDASIFPQGDFVGSSDIFLKWNGCLVCVIEVKVSFDATKYFAQALAEGYAAVAGLNSPDWLLGDAFRRVPCAVPRVILCNGSLFYRAQIDSISGGRIDGAAQSMQTQFFYFLRDLQREASQEVTGAASSPFVPSLLSSPIAEQTRARARARTTGCRVNLGSAFRRKEDDDDDDVRESDGRGGSRRSGSASHRCEQGASSAGGGNKANVPHADDSQSAGGGKQTRCAFRPIDVNAAGVSSRSSRGDVKVVRLTDLNLELWTRGDL